MGTTGQNLLFVCVDCLRQDFVSGPHADTPFLDSLREEGTEYTDLFSTATTTTPAVASLVTGSYSERNGINSLMHCELDSELPTLAELFGEAGYETAAMVTGPLLEETDLDRGYDHYWYRQEDDYLAGEWQSTAIERLDSLSEPFAAYVHLWDLHEGIEVPPEFDEPRYGDSPYARTLSALDRALEAFVDAAPDDTVVAIHGDHGESISWRPSYLQNVVKGVRDAARYRLGLDTRPLEHRLNRFADRFAPDYVDQYLERGHGETVHDFTSNVPFVLAGPGVEDATVDATCRQVDILPTLLDLLDVDVDGDPDVDGGRGVDGDLDDAFDGETLLPPEDVEDRVAYTRACGMSLQGEENWHRGVRHDGYRYVEYPDRDWEPELYDLETDPSELRSLDDEARRAELAELLPDQELMRVDELDIRDRLAELGYA